MLLLAQTLVTYPTSLSFLKTSSVSASLQNYMFRFEFEILGLIMVYDFFNDKIKRKFCSIFVENNCFFAAEVSEQEVAGWILVTGQQNVSGCIHKKSFSFSQLINSVVVLLRPFLETRLRKIFLCLQRL